MSPHVSAVPWCPLTPGVPVPRLVLRRLYPLAIRICEFLRLPEIQGVSRILAHWACYKVRGHPGTPGDSWGQAELASGTA